MDFMYIVACLTLASFAILPLIDRPIWRLEDALPDQPSQVDPESESPIPATRVLGDSTDDKPVD